MGKRNLLSKYDVDKMVFNGSIFWELEDGENIWEVGHKAIKWVEERAQFTTELPQFYVLKGHTLNHHYRIPEEVRFPKDKIFIGINVNELDEKGHDWCIIYRDEANAEFLEEILDKIEDKAREKGYDWYYYPYVFRKYRPKWMGGELP